MSKVTIARKAGTRYTLKSNEKYTIISGQGNINGHEVTIGTSGKTEFYIQVVKDGTFTLQRSLSSPNPR